MSSILSNQGQKIVPARIALAGAGFAVSVNIYFLWGDALVVRTALPTHLEVTSWVEAARGHLPGEPDRPLRRQRLTQQLERPPAQTSAAASSLQLSAGITRRQGARQ